MRTTWTTTGPRGEREELLYPLRTCRGVTSCSSVWRYLNGPSLSLSLSLSLFLLSLLPRKHFDSLSHIMVISDPAFEHRAVLADHLFYARQSNQKNLHVRPWLSAPAATH
jgi:hypothetical protein